MRSRPEDAILPILDRLLRSMARRRNCRVHELAADVPDCRDALLQAYLCGQRGEEITARTDLSEEQRRELSRRGRD